MNRKNDKLYKIWNVGCSQHTTSGPGISGNLEKSGNFNAKLGKVREFCNFRVNSPHQVIQMMITNYIPIYVYIFKKSY